MPSCPALIFSMRGVPLIDASGLYAIEHIWQLQVEHGGLPYLTGLQHPVQHYIERAGLSEEMGSDKLLWSADQAINAPTAN
jgi:sulfate permease, SulP family